MPSEILHIGRHFTWPILHQRRLKFSEIDLSFCSVAYTAFTGFHNWMLFDILHRPSQHLRNGAGISCYASTVVRLHIHKIGIVEFFFFFFLYRDLGVYKRIMRCLEYHIYPILPRLSELIR